MDNPFNKNKRKNDLNFLKKLDGSLIEPYNQENNSDIINTKKSIIINPKKENSLKTIMKFFKIGLNKDKNAPTPDKIRPLRSDGRGKIEPFSTAVMRYYKYWIEQCHDDVESFKNMVQVWQDMDMLYYNSPIIARAVDLITDEVVQADLNFQCIGVEAENKQRQFILDFFDKINLYKLIPAIVEPIILYGNQGTVLSESQEKGITELLPTQIYDFKKVLSFTAFEVKQRMEKKDKFFIEYSSRERINNLIKSILNEDNYASYFKEHILGYQIGDFVLPPWKFLHFKNKTIKSPFAPFGCPIYIHAVAPYRQYDAAMTLQVVARGARFPVDRYSINAPNTVDPISKLNIVTDFIRSYQNSGIGVTKKEEKGVGETVFTVKDLFDYDQITPNIDLGKIDDIELLRDEIIIASELPRYLIDSKDSGFGTSGISLIQQWKPFARLVYKIQSIVLENITQLVKIHMMLTNSFALDEMKFILTMPYPESQINNEIITNQKDLLDLTNNILDALSNRLMAGQPVPDELVKAVFHQIMPYDQQRIDDWIKIINDNKEKGNIDKDISYNFKNYDSKEENKRNYNYQNCLTKLCESRIIKLKNGEIITNRKRLAEEIENVIFNEKHFLLREYSMQNKHGFSSKNNYEDFNASLLRQWRKEDAIKNIKPKLMEDIIIDKLEGTKEETPVKTDTYIFEYKNEENVQETKDVKED